jgi:hypothetical protein
MLPAACYYMLHLYYRCAQVVLAIRSYQLISTEPVSDLGPLMKHPMPS